MSTSFNATRNAVMQKYLDIIDSSYSAGGITPLVHVNSHPGVLAMNVTFDGFTYYQLVVLRFKNGCLIQETINESETVSHFVDTVLVDEPCECSREFLSGYSCEHHVKNDYDPQCISCEQKYEIGFM